MNKLINESHVQCILLTVLGITPKEMAQTLHEIWTQTPDKFPSHIVVITTKKGSKSFTELMMDDSSFAKICLEHHLPPIKFDQVNILIPRDDDGNQLKDMRNERQQEIITQFITNHIRELSMIPELAIHTILPAGPKILGSVLGYAMSLFARSHDHVHHAPSNVHTEPVPHNGYSTPEPVWRAHHHKLPSYGRLTQIKTAVVSEHSMKEEIQNSVINSANFETTQVFEHITETSELTQEYVGVRLNFEHMSLWCGCQDNWQEVRLRPDCFAFYSWLAQDSNMYPGEGIGAPRTNMNVQELDQRFRDFLLAAIHPDLRADCGKIDLEELLERANDAADRAVEHDIALKLPPRGPRILQNNPTTRYLANSNRPDGEVTMLLRKRHFNLWRRLLDDTNNMLLNTMGGALANYYQIVTVNEDPGRNPFEYKGLKINANKIYFE